jgi:hypothetical protein
LEVQSGKAEMLQRVNKMIECGDLGKSSRNWREDHENPKLLPSGVSAFQ